MCTDIAANKWLCSGMQNEWFIQRAGQQHKWYLVPFSPLRAVTDQLPAVGEDHIQRLPVQSFIPVKLPGKVDEDLISSFSGMWRSSEIVVRFALFVIRVIRFALCVIRFAFALWVVGY